MKDISQIASGEAAYAAFGERKLSLLCVGLGLGHQTAAAVDLFRVLTDGWSHWTMGVSPTWPNDITDDATPFEFSVAFEGASPKVRILTESQERPFSATSTWSAGLQLNERLRNRRGVALDRFECIQPLFAPREGRENRFCLWHAATLDDLARAHFKIYVNPQIAGPTSANGIVEESLRRLGMSDALAFLSDRMRARPGRDRVLYFSLDLAPADDARVKIYIAHDGATVGQIESAIEGCANSRPGDVTDWAERLLGSTGPFEERPILTCLSFTASGGSPRATVHFPARCYLSNDQETLDRACGLLAPQHARDLRAGIQKVAGRPLEAGIGLLTYVSIRRIPGDLCVTTYIAPEAFAVCPSREFASAEMLAIRRPTGSE